jgi:hypothetical protein
MGTHTLAASFTVSGIDGFFFLLAALLFLIAGIVTWFVMPRQIWATFVAIGLLLWDLTNLIK